MTNETNVHPAEPILNDQGLKVGVVTRYAGGSIESLALNNVKAGDVVTMPNGKKVTLQSLGPESDVIV
ncbi:MAG: hypothetical protein UR39_C0002G0191 [Candidatus Woesebacteria bacterium GW2011_GWA1_33_30]|uniref:Uncharacterized protein n=1 Tax=Candidatus Woesebacteria bacterium GW2011_GWA2_33_28 TaxID=1618561 RepID=A0A0F9ZUS6_9BACT|nr:MAG: hypothetical protein UR38_C0002G0191 [Candidatus Woesebacteria bacterium GW2011_GWA2_33_28]KKP48901.1 MAG: hypothetical protein UR39_C0002G0191 [Candidatus Woesebacteria bacterium GW2011_GWA1_33_30]KKP50174.1 MAG: hypothetical protein UR40_C0002G0191 [Microgenomates group bacterium GW2011_GWC1_33_32]KKP51944.1 MAG: hypothetical protein UR44_C0006G0190 [Candidatus Woesebacteria bacterium GW2011_GWB1_33_38]KKP58268.1 MAG: hypothetical protein UR48_C0006G0017 [Microgenomates group bacteriu